MLTARKPGGGMLAVVLGKLEYNPAMEPVTTITVAFGLAKAAGEITTKLNEIYKSLQDRGAKQQVSDLLDKMHDLKPMSSRTKTANFERSCVSKVTTTRFTRRFGT